MLLLLLSPQCGLRNAATKEHSNAAWRLPAPSRQKSVPSVTRSMRSRLTCVSPRSFSELNPPGGYRDVNIKLKIGFRSITAPRGPAPLDSFDILFRDCESSRNPLFLPVQEWNEQAGVKRLVVEVQLHLKVRCACSRLRLTSLNYRRFCCIYRVSCLVIPIVSPLI